MLISIIPEAHIEIIYTSFFSTITKRLGARGHKEPSSSLKRFLPTNSRSLQYGWLIIQLINVYWDIHVI